MPRKRKGPAPSGPPRRRRAPSGPELEGYLVGVRERLDSLTPDPTRAAEVSDRLARAAELLRTGRRKDAERILLEADAVLDSVSPEVELLEFPRGLVGYVPAGERGSAPGREDDGVANRLLLVQRLLQVRRASGYSVDDLLPRLVAAEAAYQAGDRAMARRICDEVHHTLELLGEDSGPPSDGQAYGNARR